MKLFSDLSVQGGDVLAGFVQLGRGVVGDGLVGIDRAYDRGGDVVEGYQFGGEGVEMRHVEVEFFEEGAQVGRGGEGVGYLE